MEKLHDNWVVGLRHFTVREGVGKNIVNGNERWIRAEIIRREEKEERRQAMIKAEQKNQKKNKKPPEYKKNVFVVWKQCKWRREKYERKNERERVGSM